MTIKYTLKPSRPQAHLFSVTLSVARPGADGQRLSLPNWIPGSYMIREFARNITAIRASSDGVEVALEKLDKSTWQAPAGLSELTVEYEVYAWDLSVRTAHLDTTHGFFNGTSVFLCAEGHQHEPCVLQLLRPDIDGDTDPGAVMAGSTYAKWRVATSLPVQKKGTEDFTFYEAANYDELIDHPVEMGCFERAEFEVCGVPHELVLTGPCKTDTDKICADLKVICEQQIRFFGEPAPMQRYVFLVMVVGKGYGGLEHRASTSLLVTREDLPVPGAITRSEDYIRFLGLCSHEYFHTWNVKRIKPARFVPYQLKAESHTELLWFFEGVTSYYDDLFLVRSSLVDTEQYLELLGKTITRVQRGSGRFKQSVAESSFDAWTRFYRQDENAPNAIVSYYAKGALVALCLDMLIRHHSGNSRSLDDLMRVLWSRWLAGDANGQPVGVTQQEIENLATELAGFDLSGFFDNAVFGTQDLDLQQALSCNGIDIGWRAATSEKDTGGKAAQASANSSLTLGVRTSASAGGLKIDIVFEDGAAQLAGLAAGDVVLAIDQISVSQTPIDKILSRHAEGDVLKVHAFRHGYLMTFSVILKAAPIDTCWLSVTEAPTATMQAQLDGWLSVSTASSIAGGTSAL